MQTLYHGCHFLIRILQDPFIHFSGKARVIVLTVAGVFMYMPAKIFVCNRQMQTCQVSCCQFNTSVFAALFLAVELPGL